jgi:enoyl-CoA hydratase/carnithine racemase
MSNKAERIEVELESPLAWITINRPDKHNAFSTSMWEALVEAIHALEANSDVRVILLKGAGEKAFSAGADIDGFREKVDSEGDAPTKVDRPTESAFLVTERCKKPTISVITGICFGGGCAIALSTDFRLASDDSRFAITPVRLGLGYPFEGVRRAVEELGPSNARLVLMTARRFDAVEAKDLGIVHEVHGRDELMDAARKLGHELAANAPKSVATIKESVAQVMLPESERDLANLDAMIKDCFDSEDFREGLRAFNEKRPPEFKDR